MLAMPVAPRRRCAHRVAAKTPLRLDQLEDRFVPGETLAAILFAPMGIGALPEIVGQPATVRTHSCAEADSEAGYGGREALAVEEGLFAIGLDVSFGPSDGHGETVGGHKSLNDNADVGSSVDVGGSGVTGFGLDDV